MRFSYLLSDPAVRKSIVDTPVVVGGVTAPWWTSLAGTATDVAVIVGAVIALGRLYLLVLDIRDRMRKDTQDERVS